MTDLDTSARVRNVSVRTHSGVQAMLLDYESEELVPELPTIFEEIPKALHLLTIGQDEIQSIGFNGYQKVGDAYEFTPDSLVIVTLKGVTWDWNAKTNSTESASSFDDPEWDELSALLGEPDFE